jgi:hypothetical protein
MAVSKFFARVAFVAALAWVGGPALGADVVAPRPVAPAVVGAPPALGGAGPVIVEGEAAPGGCATCQHGAAAGTCSRCAKWLALHKHKGQFPVTLCPGACFGYFQTQWRKWDEVCPYPYLGTGVSDALRVPGPVVAPKAGSELNPPRTLDPKAAPKMPEPKKLGAAPVGVPAPKAAPAAAPVLKSYAVSDLPPIPPAPSKFVP